MTRIRMAASALALLAVPAGLSPAAADEPSCTDQTDEVYAIPADVVAGGGKYALPAETPETLVVFAHGYGHTSDSWVTHMRRTADHGAITFALDYPGTFVDGEGSVRGWFVREGAERSVALAQAFQQLCGIDTVIIYGVSMGGNTSGLAVAMKATRLDSEEPLFDYWVAGEPAANVIETYLEASAVEAAVPFAAKAKADIEAEHGGTLLEQPQSYMDGAVVLQADDIAASGIKGVAIVHGFDDGLVPYNQGRELWAVLRAHGVPTDFYNAARRETDGTPNGSDNTTLSENVLGPTGMWNEPLAGHGTESSQTNIVIQTGLELVFDLIEGTSIPASREFVVDGELGIVPVL